MYPQPKHVFNMFNFLIFRSDPIRSVRKWTEKHASNGPSYEAASQLMAFDWRSDLAACLTNLGPAARFSFVHPVRLEMSIRGSNTTLAPSYNPHRWVPRTLRGTPLI